MNQAAVHQKQVLGASCSRPSSLSSFRFQFAGVLKATTSVRNAMALMLTKEMYRSAVTFPTHDALCARRLRQAAGDGEREHDGQGGEDHHRPWHLHGEDRGAGDIRHEVADQHPRHLQRL